MKSCKFIGVVMSIIMLLLCTVPVFAATAADTTEYAVNENGETYGNYLQALEIGHEADLIQARGENGVIGYVRQEDLDDGVDSPEEAVNRVESYYIPLYAQDGVTVIGRFLIGGFDSESVQTRASFAYGNQDKHVFSNYSAFYKSGICGASMRRLSGRTEIITTEIVYTSWIGAAVRFYDELTGTMQHDSGFQYNSGDTTSFTRSYIYVAPNYGGYYVQGEVKLWNSNTSSYVRKNTEPSPSVIPG